MNLRPLGYEPYDERLWRLGLSLTGAVTSTDRTGPISLRRLRLPCLALSRRVRFTNRFTEQAIDLRVPVPSLILVAAGPRAVAVTFRLAKRPRDLAWPRYGDGRDAAIARRAASAERRPRPAGSASNRGSEAGWLDDPLLTGRSVCAAGQPACTQVSRCTGLSGSDRKFPALTGRSGPQRARRLRSRTTVRTSAPGPATRTCCGTMTVCGEVR